MNPGVTPTPGTPEYGRDKPGLGSGEEAEPNKPFSLPPEPGAKGAEAPEMQPHPSPMDAAGEGARQQAQMTPEQLGSQVEGLKNQLSNIGSQLQNPDVTGKFSPDHYEALNRVVEKMTPDMRSIANNSQTEFNPPQRASGESVLGFVTHWINGAQGTLSAALNYVGTEKSPNPASFLKLQYAVQRASQRGELFASIVGSSVSGIKTIMSTQLG